jgi:2-polyprenyl-3-methyl-5-hydroxy-6-metoxy-1,4-benzoquinol methylase
VRQIVLRSLGAISMTFEALFAARSVADYADFFLPYLTPAAHVLDVGCGAGTITIGLAKLAGHVLGVDLDEAEFAEAGNYANRHGIGNIEFRSGSVCTLEVPTDTCCVLVSRAGQSLKKLYQVSLARR